MAIPATHQTAAGGPAAHTVSRPVTRPTVLACPVPLARPLLLAHPLPLPGPSARPVPPARPVTVPRRVVSPIAPARPIPQTRPVSLARPVAVARRRHRQAAAAQPWLRAMPPLGAGGQRSTAPVRLHGAYSPSRRGRSHANKGGGKLELVSD